MWATKISRVFFLPRKLLEVIRRHGVDRLDECEFSFLREQPKGDANRAGLEKFSSNPDKPMGQNRTGSPSPYHRPSAHKAKVQVPPGRRGGGTERERARRVSRHGSEIRTLLRQTSDLATGGAALQAPPPSFFSSGRRRCAGSPPPPSSPPRSASYPY